MNLERSQTISKERESLLEPVDVGSAHNCPIPDSPVLFLQRPQSEEDDENENSEKFILKRPVSIGGCALVTFPLMEQFTFTAGLLFYDRFDRN